MGVGLGEGGVVAFDTASTDYVVPALSQTLLLGGRHRPLRLRGDWGAGCTTHLAAHDRRPLSKRRLGLLQFRTAPVVGCVVSSAVAALKLLLWGGALP